MAHVSVDWYRYSRGDIETEKSPVYVAWSGTTQYFDWYKNPTSTTLIRGISKSEVYGYVVFTPYGVYSLSALDSTSDFTNDCICDYHTDFNIIAKAGAASYGGDAILIDRSNGIWQADDSTLTGWTYMDFTINDEISSIVIDSVSITYSYETDLYYITILDNGGDIYVATYTSGNDFFNNVEQVNQFPGDGLGTPSFLPETDEVLMPIPTNFSGTSSSYDFSFDIDYIGDVDHWDIHKKAVKDCEISGITGYDTNGILYSVFDYDFDDYDGTGTLYVFGDNGSYTSFSVGGTPTPPTPTTYTHFYAWKFNNNHASDIQVSKGGEYIDGGSGGRDIYTIDEVVTESSPFFFPNGDQIFPNYFWDGDGDCPYPYLKVVDSTHIVFDTTWNSTPSGTTGEGAFVRDPEHDFDIETSNVGANLYAFTTSSSDAAVAGLPTTIYLVVPHPDTNNSSQDWTVSEFYFDGNGNMITWHLLTDYSGATIRNKTATSFEWYSSGPI